MMEIKKTGTSIKITKKIVPKKSETSNISKKYKKMDHEEHVLKKPDSYLGSVNIEETFQYVLDEGNIENTVSVIN